MKILIIITLTIMAVSVNAQVNTINYDNIITGFTIAIPFTGEITIRNYKKNLINELEPIVVMEIVEKTDEIHFFICEENKRENSPGNFSNINSESRGMATLAL